MGCYHGFTQYVFSAHSKWKCPGCDRPRPERHDVWCDDCGLEMCWECYTPCDNAVYCKSCAEDVQLSSSDEDTRGYGDLA